MFSFRFEVLGSCVFIGPYFKEIKKQLRDRVNELTSKTKQDIKGLL